MRMNDNGAVSDVRTSQNLLDLISRILGSNAISALEDYDLRDKYDVPDHMFLHCPHLDSRPQVEECRDEITGVRFHCLRTGFGYDRVVVPDDSVSPTLWLLLTREGTQLFLKNYQIPTDIHIARWFQDLPAGKQALEQLPEASHTMRDLILEASMEKGNAALEQFKEAVGLYRYLTSRKQV